MTIRIDATDRKILAELQRDASQSLDEIARNVGSSKTPVWNRIRKLRESGVIGQQTVVLDAEAAADAGLGAGVSGRVQQHAAGGLAGPPGPAGPSPM